MFALDLSFQDDSKVMILGARRRVMSSHEGCIRTYDIES